MIPTSAALKISTLFGMVFMLMFTFSPHSVLLKYEIYTPPVGRKAVEPSAMEFSCIYYFVILLALGMFSITATLSAVDRIGHSDTMKTSLAASALGRAALLGLVLSKPLSEPMKKQLVVSGALFAIQALGATTGGLPKLQFSAPKSSSAKSCLVCAVLALLQVSVVWLKDPVVYMAGMGLEVYHPQAKEAFETVVKMWCVVMGSAALTRIVVVLAGDKDTIYAVNRSSCFYYGMLFGAMASFKAILSVGADPPMGANVQFFVIFVYFFGSVTGTVLDDEGGYAKAAKKKK